MKEKKVEKFIDIEKVLQSKSPKLYKWLPSFLVNYLKKITHEDDANYLFTELKDDYDTEFCIQMLKQFNIPYSATGLENIPRSGAVVLVANHPLGGLDAMAVMATISQRRSDVKIIVNDILMNVKNLKGSFVGVNKHGATSKEAFQKINELFASDKATFIYPAGMVSRKKKGIVRDLEWKRTFIFKAREHNSPIIPIHISGELSSFFYKLSNIREGIGIKANLEMLYLINEQFKLGEKPIHLTIGKPILPKDLNPTKTDHELAQWMQDQVYNLVK